MNVKNELQNIVSGDATVKFGVNIQVIIEYLEEKRKQFQEWKKQSSSKNKKQSSQSEH